ncbi:MAG: hypothetical protein ABT940_04670 [Alphaproteobacteria bacterium]
MNTELATGADFREVGTGLREVMSRTENQLTDQTAELLIVKRMAGFNLAINVAILAELMLH